MACWSKFRVSTRIQNLGCFVAVILVAFLLLSDGLVDMVEAITHAGDIQALKQVLMAVNAASIKPSSCLGSWNFSMDPCDARSSAHFTCGIDCSPATINGERYITGLQLERGAGYQGILSPHIGRLTALQRLILSGNSFHGRIPASLANLKELVQLDLSVNSFSGSLPESLGLLQNIEFFSVAYNLLDGQIPKSFSNLTSIICMYLNNNQLSGNMPEFLELKQLKYLDASDNRLSGPLPAQLPPMLRLLSLGKNYLTGDLPL
jgi:Leucine-rich repeat (LRR) protein